MQTISTSAAVALVRKNLEELDPNGSAMYGPTEVGSSDVYGDNQSLDSIIARNLPEAINAVHLAAPVQLLDGETYNVGADEAEIDSEGVLTFSMSPSPKYLRLVAFKADDSDIVVTDAIPEASPEGRKQLNPYIRGRADRPRLVHCQGKQPYPVFRYYSITDPDDYGEGQEAISRFEYIMEHLYIAPTQGTPDPTYKISIRLRQNIIDYLTAKVMETYSDQRAQVYYQKASIYPSI